jgi:hypothetical protein
MAGCVVATDHEARRNYSFIVSCSLRQLDCEKVADQLVNAPIASSGLSAFMASANSTKATETKRASYPPGGAALTARLP